jgi:hypothetical protein
VFTKGNFLVTGVVLFNFYLCRYFGYVHMFMTDIFLLEKLLSDLNSSPPSPLRFLMYNPAHREDFVEYLIEIKQYAEAALQLSVCLNDEHFISPSGMIPRRLLRETGPYFLKYFLSLLLSFSCSWHRQDSASAMDASM